MINSELYTLNSTIKNTHESWRSRPCYGIYYCLPLPQHKKQPFDLKGMEGEIIDIITNWQGSPVSSNLPVLVKFDKRFKAHFRDHELEVIKAE